MNQVTTLLQSTNKSFFHDLGARKSLGFTLIEVMIALVIFSIAAAALIGNITNASHAHQQLQVRTLSFWVAQNKMTELHLQPHWPNEGTTNGQAEKMMGQDWYWTMKVVATSAKNLRRVELEVRRNPEQDNADAQLVGFIGKF